MYVANPREWEERKSEGNTELGPERSRRRSPRKAAGVRSCDVPTPENRYGWGSLDRAAQWDSPDSKQLLRQLRACMTGDTLFLNFLTTMGLKLSQSIQLHLTPLLRSPQIPWEA